MRYNIGQVKKIIELVYLPHQVDQWNRYVNGDKEIRPVPYNDEGKPVILEEVLPDALEEAVILYGRYVQIPQGEFYIAKKRDCCFISRKKYQGFVTGELNFEYCPTERSSFELPDWQIFIPWEDNGLLHPGNSTHFNYLPEMISEKALEEYVNQKIDERSINGNFRVYRSNHVCRELGYVPETGEVKGAE
jgi:hypothetical protein